MNEPATPAEPVSVLPESVSRRRSVRLRLRRPRGRTALLLAGVPPLLLLVGFGLLLVAVDVPRPESLANPQVSLITYSDGPEIGRVGAQNRVEVPLSKVSEAAQKAVLAAENRDYYSEPGISPKGILRAAWANLRGGGVQQGASTITQQYAKNAYLNSERSYSRKLKEVVIAIKLDRSYTKDEVLEFYLNTVYFGRGSYGIEVAAQTYFGKPAAQLTAAEGAVLAALLRSPSGYDPADQPEQARKRWDYVVRGMQDEGWLEESRLTYPEVRPKPKGDSLAGPSGYLLRQVQDELEANGIFESQIRSAGLRIVTTVDSRMQAEAVKAVHDVTGEQVPDGVHRALVAVEPGTGRIRAEYAGADYVTRPFNDATQGIAQAGSTFKPYVLAAALDSQVSLKTRMNGASPQTFGSYEVSNYGPGAGEQFGDIDLVQATAHSVNTVFVPLGERAGLSHVADIATRLGVTADMSKESQLPSFPLGTTAVRPIDQAVAYATLAARGERADAYIVEKVSDSAGRVVYEAEQSTSEAVTRDVADDTTHALQQVVLDGTGRRAGLAGRPSAGKTGTTNNNTAAWFVGYTPQLATAVALFSERQDTPLRGIAGVGEVTGGSLPAMAWRQFMNAAHEGQPVREFPPPVWGGVEPVPSPSPEPTPSASPSTIPTPSVFVPPTPAAEPTPYVYDVESSEPQPSQPPRDQQPSDQQPSEQPTSSEPSPGAEPSPETVSKSDRGQSEPAPSPSESAAL